MVDFDFDFNNAKEEYALIPADTVAKAILNLKREANDPDSFLKHSKNGSLYLDCVFTIMEGKYAKRRIFHKIGLDGNSIWVHSSRVFMRNLLESAYGISKRDTSPEAEEKRKISKFEDLDGLVVVVRIGIEEGGEFPDKNKIKCALTPDAPEYKSTMNSTSTEDKWPF